MAEKEKDLMKADPLENEMLQTIKFKNAQSPDPATACSVLFMCDRTWLYMLFKVVHRQVIHD